MLFLQANILYVFVWHVYRNPIQLYSSYIIWKVLFRTKTTITFCFSILCPSDIYWSNSKPDTGRLLVYE